jgi:D-alanyl-D-alanine carboxypeptidase (penicillin-binding protein 5/6)
MMKTSITTFLLASLLFCCFFIGLSVTPATAVPVLRDKAKRPVTAVQRQSITKKSSPKNIKTLGNHKKSSSHKKKIATSKHKAAVKAKKNAVAKIGMAQNSRQNKCTIEKKISAKSAFIMDAANGQTIFAVSPDTPRQPASTIKILTGMIAIKSLDFSETVPVSYKAAGQPSSKIYLDQEKLYKADDLINAVLLSSANDASVALAEKIAGSEQSFARMMTLRAKLWGATRTVCKTANGLTAEGQSTTARDLATIFRHVMQDAEFSHRMKQVKSHTAEGKLLRNHNKALWQIEGALGGKTGFTNAAGQTYVGKFKRGSSEIIVAIMGSRTMWADLKALVEYGFSEQASTVADTTENMKKIRVVASIPMVNRQQ